MKRVLTILIVILCVLSVSAQMNRLALADEKFDNNSYVIVFNDSTVTRQEMFSNAKVWISKNFNDYKAVIQLEDSEKTKIIIKGIIPTFRIHDVGASAFTDYFVNIHFTLTIDCRDNKFRLKFENISVKGEKIVDLGVMKQRAQIDMSLTDFMELSRDKIFGLDVSPYFVEILNSAKEGITIKDNF